MPERITYEMPLAEGAQFRIECAVLAWKVERTGTVNVGKCCYIDREHSASSKNIFIDESSFDAGRARALEKLVRTYAQLERSGAPGAHCRRRVATVVQVLGWADRTGLKFDMEDPESCLVLLEQWHQYCDRSVADGTMDFNRSVALKTSAASTFRTLFDGPLGTRPFKSWRTAGYLAEVVFCQQPVVISMPLAAGVDVTNPESLHLRWERLKRTIDIGQVCYLQREIVGTQPVNHVFKEESLCTLRQTFVRTFTLKLSELGRQGHLSASDCQISAAGVREWLNWADRQKILFDANDPKAALSSVESYFESLLHRVMKGDLNKNGIADRQTYLRNILRAVFDDDAWGSELRILKRSWKHTTPTEAPLERTQGYLFAACRQLFRAISEHTLSNAPFPVLVRGPFGVERAASEVRICANLRMAHRNTPGWDSETGLPRDNESTRAVLKRTGQYSNDKSLTPQQRYNQSAKLASGARASHEGASLAGSFSRTELAYLACSCFAYMLAAILGQSPTEFCALDVDRDDIESLLTGKRAKQNWRELKMRAFGLEVSMETPIEFIGDIRIYLKLRRHLLGDQELPAFLLSRAKSNDPQRLTPVFLAGHFDRLETLGIEVPRVTMSELRAARQNYGITHLPLTDAAAFSNHSERTAIRKYSNGTGETVRHEVGSFLEQLQGRRIMPAGKKLPGSKKVALGACASAGKPVPIRAEVEIEPECGRPEGCLFCNQLRVHADETDCRKLLSCRFCVKETSKALGSDEADAEYFSPILHELDEVLRELATRLPAGRFEDIRQDVEARGNLDPYWQTKFEQLLELGIV